MKSFLCTGFLSVGLFFMASAQRESRTPSAASAVIPATPGELSVDKLNAATAVKNQGQTGTCWCFSGTSLLESQYLKNNSTPIDLSEMFTVRNIYFEKARNYFLRQGHAQFGEGGLGHDVIRSFELYGAMPEGAFKSTQDEKSGYNHSALVQQLKAYLDSEIIRAGRGDVSERWQNGVNKLLNVYLGVPPTEFSYAGKNYTAKTFAKEYLRFNESDYVSITSFTDHPYYSSFVLSVPDNFSNGSFYNLPLAEMTEITKNAIKSGYTVLWDADVSNSGFSQKNGIALNIAPDARINPSDTSFNRSEESYTAEKRQQLFEDLVTQDDHLMHIIGLEKTRSGKSFFVVKNSWGQVGPYKGYINVSEPYFAANTISLVIPKAALTKAQLDKLHIQ